jgi:hypothetical protein
LAEISLSFNNRIVYPHDDNIKNEIFTQVENLFLLYGLFEAKYNTQAANSCQFKKH